MKSDIFPLGSDRTLIQAALNGAEEIATLRLSEKDQLTLRLLCEELISCVATILEKYDGSFWVESDGSAFEIHLLASANVDRDARDALIDLSSAKKNTAPKGFLAKLGMMIESILDVDNFDPTMMSASSMGLYGNGVSMLNPSDSVLTWTMSSYINENQEKIEKDELEGIEKSIIEKIADEVLVTARNRRVEIVVQKRFDVLQPQK